MKKLATVLSFTVISCYGFAQSGKLDSLFASSDTTAIMDSLLKDFDKFLDSLTKPKSFFSVSIGAGTGYFSFKDKTSSFVHAQKKIIVTPSAGYYHKSGFGISAAAYVMNDNNGINFYQYALGPSYDCIRKNLSTGISYTRYFSKDSLDFYATPIQNELFAYFSYKKWWVRPTISFSYGWGSHAEYEKRRLFRNAALLSQRNRYYIIVKNEESVRDLSMTISVRKDFDWYSVLGKEDNITFTPVVMLNSGTQNFGFNTSYSYSFTAIRANSLPSNQELSDNTQFALQSTSVALRGSYLKGRFLVSAQTLFDYYLGEQDSERSRLNTVFSITTGWSF